MLSQNKSEQFKLGMQVIVTKPSQADIKEGIRGDMLGTVEDINTSFVHVRMASNAKVIYPFFPHQIRPF